MNESSEQTRTTGVTPRQVNEQLALELQHAHAEIRKLRASEAELRATALFRERLIGIVGHDLRNPLSAVLMAARLLAMGGRLTPADTALVARISNSGQRMLRMIDQVLEFTQAHVGGGFALKLAELDLGASCEVIAAELRLGGTAEIDVTTAGNMVGHWDVDRIEEAISNLAGNAVEHATPGTRVGINVRDGNAGGAVVEVTNFGTPIPDHVLAGMFNPFRHGENLLHTRGKHLGLGLYIAREVVSSHAGTLDVRSERGTTTFTMNLPRRT